MDWFERHPKVRLLCVVVLSVFVAGPIFAGVVLMITGSQTLFRWTWLLVATIPTAFETYRLMKRMKSEPKTKGAADKTIDRVLLFLVGLIVFLCLVWIISTLMY